ncbi:Ribosomal protein S6 modification protein [Halorhabdus tiamatea SARL4B]|uniref:Coenzyme gamma-F420-2:L-glutamate ligase n=1 Tax=Halorhabdus tiamatea SARL4B TaxID=1033806 RepID=F7PF27_9EURY|nr:RimK family alpha-L-glutamate ligase [Halorhabdus tiamatea]ERJ06015.1 Ribosomal protein S6 modification protein [Halorhabdus tiamatea SARL4B]CCQ34423.1 coenzyme gamma-F420-2:L-glutamate ligase [Halorhabdus tiamatea SARL4B]
MLRLAVATQAESYDRLREPLAERDIDVVALQTTERTIPIGGVSFPDVDVGYVFPPRLMEGDVAAAALSVPWVNDRAAVLRSRNKAGTLQRLSDAGVSVPETVLISDPVEREDLIAAFDRFDPPVLVKPNSASRGAGVTLAHDLDSFLGIADYLDLVHDYRAADDQSFLVQEYVPDAHDYRVMVLDGAVIGAVERRLPEAVDTDRWKHNVHHGGTPTPVELDDESRAIAERVADVLEIPLLGVDLLATEGRIVVTETNARPTIDPEHYADGFWDRLAATIRRVAGRDGHR